MQTTLNTLHDDAIQANRVDARIADRNALIAQYVERATIILKAKDSVAGKALMASMHADGLDATTISLRILAVAKAAA